LNAGAGGHSLRVERISKRFGGLLALDSVSLEARPGKVTSIIGQNGAGKTTLLNVICQMPRPDHGRVFVGSRDLTGLAPSRIVRAGVARTFQQLRIFEKLTVRENVLLAFQDNDGEQLWRLALSPARVWHNRKRQRTRADEILERLALANHAGEIAGSLSYGHQKLLSLARVVATEAPVVMLDEPTSGLAGDMIERILAIVRHMASSKRTVLLIEHDMEVVFDVSDWVVVLDQGRLFCEDTPNAVRVNDDVRAIYFGSRVQ